MTFTIQTKPLQQALAAVGAVIPSKPVIMILNNILVEVSQDSLSLTASNSEQTITMRVPAETQDTFKFLINARDLKEIVNAANFDTMTFDVSDNAVNIGCGFSDYTMPVLPPNEFPTQEYNAEPTAKLSMHSNDIRNAISRVSHAVGTDEIRPAMRGVYFDLTGDTFTAVATDTRVLAKTSVPYEIETPTSAIIPSQALAILQGSFLSEPVCDVTLYPTGAIFECGDNKFATVLIAGNYPKYERVIPQSYRVEAKMNRKNFMSAVSAASVFASATGMVRLSFTPYECVVSVSNLDCQQKATSKCKCDFSGSEMSINFNIKYLQSVLKSIDTEEVSLRMTEDSLPGVFYGVDDDSTLNLVMPMKGE